MEKLSFEIDKTFRFAVSVESGESRVGVAIKKIRSLNVGEVSALNTMSADVFMFAGIMDELKSLMRKPVEATLTFFDAKGEETNKMTFKKFKVFSLAFRDLDYEVNDNVIADVAFTFESVC